MIKLLALCAATLSAQSFEGHWQGNLPAGAVKLRLAFHITRDAKGEFSSTFDSIDQGAMGIPAAKTSVDGLNIHIEIPGAAYDGTLSADGNSIEGKFKQGASLPLTLARLSKPEPPPNRPQTPKPPFPYTSEDVSFKTGGGTLTIPQGSGPFPAVVLITGSGTHDRDETLFGHKPFWVIADYLTRRGIAVLRVDDRKDKMRSSFDTLANDILAEVDYLASRKEINAKKIGVIGHSEGASLGPLAATRSERIAFVVMLAGIGVTGEEVLMKQGEMVVRSQGLGDAAVEMQRKIQQPLLDIVKTEPDENAAAEKLLAALKKAAPGAPEDILKAQVRAANSPEIRAIINFDAAPILRKLKVPVLAMNGSRDIQVPASQNLPAIRALLTEAGNRDFQIVELPNLNHLFQTCKKCTLAEYGELEESFSPDALKIMGDWLKDHTK